MIVRLFILNIFIIIYSIYFAFNVINARHIQTKSAEGRTRTGTRFPSQPPQDCVSTSSTTSAKIKKLIILDLKQVDCLLFQTMAAVWVLDHLQMPF